RAPGRHDLLEVLGTQLVLVLPLLVLAGGVDEEDRVIRLATTEEEQRRRNADTIEEVSREADHAVEEVLFDQPAADHQLAPAAEEHAVRHHDAYAAIHRVGGLDHVTDEREVPPALRRGATEEALVAVGRGAFRAPLVQRERR